MCDSWLYLCDVYKFLRISANQETWGLLPTLLQLTLNTQAVQPHRSLQRYKIIERFLSQHLSGTPTPGKAIISLSPGSIQLSKSWSNA